MLCSRSAVHLSSCRFVSFISQTALKNTKIAEKEQARQRKRTLGILHHARKAPDVVASDPKLDPWVQVGEGVG